MSVDETPQLLDDEEVQFLVLSAAIGHGDAGVTKEAAAKVIDWATGTRTDMSLLNLVMGGQLVVRVQEDGELEFRTADEPYSFKAYLRGERPV